MKKIFTKKNLMPAIVLGVICLISAALMGGINSVTAPEIEKQQLEAIQESLEQVIPGGDFEVSKVSKDAPDVVTGIYTDKNGKGNVVTLAVKGYKSTILMTVGVDTDGKVIKAIVTFEEESHGKAGMSNYTDNFIGLNGEGVDSVEIFTGATVTSTAMKNGIYDALVALGYADPRVEVLPRTDDELIALASEIMPEANKFKNITPEDTTLLKRLYKDTAGNGYVAYIHTYAQHGGGLESETIISISTDGEILAVNNIFWKVGHNIEIAPPPPPSDEAVKAFFDSYVGITKEEIESVELITDATGTSQNVSDAIREALVSVPAQESNLPRIIGIAILSLSAVTAVAVIIFKRRKNG